MPDPVKPATRILAATLAAAACHAAAPYRPTLESLSQCEPAPGWFRDAKVGIYFHWGVYSVPAFGSEWYPRNMYLEDSAENKHHVATWGDPASSGYPDFVPMFKAEKFDADEWAGLFERAGARFAGPVCEHHDGFAMWDSALTPWNAADMGPRRDITGELEKAIRARGMKFVATFHHARNNLWEKGGPGRWTGHYEGVKRNYPQLLEDPQRAILYGYMPRDRFVEMWKGKLFEVIDRYRPDLIWFDSWLDEIPEQARFEFAAHYLNRAREWGREVVITRKQDDLPLGFSLEDFEKGRADRLTANCWLTDDTISQGSWCFTENLRIKPADEVIDTMVDIVSKNGHLLLNISPKADGTIPQDQRAVLLELGDWLKLNGEAIYETRPWLAYGEGPTRMKKGGHFVGTVSYGAGDIRYTRSKDGRVLYAIALGWPEGELTLGSVKAGGRGRVSLLGRRGPVDHRIDDAGRLVIRVPGPADADGPGRHACAFRIEGFDLALHPDVAFEQPGALRLDAAAAVLEGDQLQLEEKSAGRRNIGFWDNPRESVHWLARLPAAGRYRLRLEHSGTLPTRLRIEVAGRALAADLPATGGWDKPRATLLGSVDIGQPGVHHLVVHPESADSWSPVNLWSLEIAPE